MHSFSSQLFILTAIGTFLKFVALFTIVPYTDLEGYLLITPLILLILSVLAYKFAYHPDTKEIKSSRCIHCILLVVLASVISFAIVFFSFIAGLKASGFRG